MTIYYVLLGKYPERMITTKIVDGLYKINGNWFNVVHDIAFTVVKNENLYRLEGMALSKEVIEKDIDKIYNPYAENVLEYIYEYCESIPEYYIYDQYFVFSLFPFISTNLNWIRVIFRNVSRILCSLEIWIRNNKLHEIVLHEYLNRIPCKTIHLHKHDLERLGLNILEDFRKFKSLREIYNVLSS